MGTLGDADRARAARGRRPAAHAVTELVHATAGAGGSARGDESLAADAVILAAPAHAGRPRCSGRSTRRSRDARRDRVRLDGHRDARVSTAELPRCPASASSCRGAGSPLIACTYSARKFPDRAPEGHDVVRAFVGGTLRPHALDQGDDALVAGVRAAIRASSASRGAAVRPRLAPSARDAAVRRRHLDRVAVDRGAGGGARRDRARGRGVSRRRRAGLRAQRRGGGGRGAGGR
jgi:hypothetical protein